MAKTLWLFNLILFFSILKSDNVFSQAPNLINYQGVARNAAGNPLQNQTIYLRVNIRTGSSQGVIQFSETRSVKTNAWGLFAVQIGSPGFMSSIGTLAGVTWMQGDKFMEVEIDPTASNNYINLGSTQLLSVPYALNAVSAGTASPIGGAGGDLSGSYPNPTIANNKITSLKLADSSVVTSKVANYSITDIKIESVSGSKIIGDIIGNAKNVNGIVAIANGGTGASNTSDAKKNLLIDSVDNTTDLRKPISIATQNALNLKLNISDTLGTFSNRLKMSDTAAMLSNRLKISDTASMLSNRLKISDTANFVSNYRRTTTKIENTDLSKSTISGVSLGDNLKSLSTSYGLSGTGFNGSADISNWKVDTAAISTKANVTALLEGYTTTGSIATKLNISDTASMLSNRLKISDTANFVSNYRRTTTKIENTDLSKSTISGVSLGDNLKSLSTSYGLSGTGFNGSADISNWKVDTAAISTKANVTALLEGYTTTGSIATKLNISDTASMLANRFKNSDTASFVSNYRRTTTKIENADLSKSTISGVSLGDNLKSLSTSYGLSGTGFNGSADISNWKVDTAAISTKANVTALLEGYTTTGSIATKLNISDTASMLSNRLKISDTASMLANRLKISDTANFVSNYRRTTTKIENIDLSKSTISGVSLGDNLKSLSASYGLSGTGFNGSAVITDWKVDTAAISTKANVTALLEGYTTTGSIATKLNISDTASMLANRFKNSDTASFVSNYRRTTTKIENADLSKSTISGVSLGDNLKSLSTSYGLSGTGFNGSADISNWKVDTAAISTKANVTALLEGYTTTGSIATKLNISDTASMLSNRLKISDTASMLANRLKISDTANFVSNYRRTTTKIENIDLSKSTISGVSLGDNLKSLSASYGLSGTGFNGSADISNWKVDTAAISTKANVTALLEGYTTTGSIATKLNISDTASMLANRFKNSDTASFVSNYRRTTTKIENADLSKSTISGVSLGDNLKSLSTSYGLSGTGFNGSADISNWKVDTAAISTKANVTALLEGYTTTGSIATKLNISDTASMLANRFKNSDTASFVSNYRRTTTKIENADLSKSTISGVSLGDNLKSLSTSYGLSGTGFNGSADISNWKVDTAAISTKANVTALLEGYTTTGSIATKLNISDTASMLANRFKNSDTASFVSNYRRTTTKIENADLSKSTISGVSLGDNLKSLSTSYGLSGTGFNGSADISNWKVDTAAISTKANVTALLEGYTTTGSIATKLNISDTASMLANRFKNSDTASFVSNYRRTTTKIENADLSKSTISGVSLGDNLKSLSTSYGLSGTGFNGSADISNWKVDTAAISTKANVTALLEGYTTTGSIATKLNISDTASMLANRFKNSDTASFVSNYRRTTTKIENADLSKSTISGVSLGDNLKSLSASYGLSGTGFNGSADISNWKVDTAAISTKANVTALLEGYTTTGSIATKLNISDTASMLANRFKNSDTASFVSNYRRTTTKIENADLSKSTIS